MTSLSAAAERKTIPEYPSEFLLAAVERTAEEPAVETFAAAGWVPCTFAEVAAAVAAAGEHTHSSSACCLVGEEEAVAAHHTEKTVGAAEFDCCARHSEEAAPDRTGRVRNLDRHRTYHANGLCGNENHDRRRNDRANGLGGNESHAHGHDSDHSEESCPT